MAVLNLVDSIASDTKRRVLTQMSESVWGNFCLASPDFLQKQNALFAEQK